MEFEKKRDELIVHLEDKVVKLRGHQDNDAFTVFVESLETHPSLTQKEIKEITQEIDGRNDIVF